MFGRARDNFGRKRLMLIGVAISVVGQSSARSQSTRAELVIGRIIMGVGAAASEPAPFIDDPTHLPDHKARARASVPGRRCRDWRSRMGPVMARSGRHLVVAARSSGSPGFGAWFHRRRDRVAGECQRHSQEG